MFAFINAFKTKPAPITPAPKLPPATTPPPPQPKFSS